MQHVAILTYHHSSLFELGCAVELFALKRPEFETWYQCDVVTFDSGLQASTGEIQLLAKTIDTLEPYSMLVVPSWPTHVTSVKGTLPREIKAFHQQGKRILSFCSGAFLLATLGILDGRTVTTHWRYAERFKARFPDVDYVDDVLYVYDGQIGCSAGSAAAIDLGIEVIRHDYGYAIANQVARRLVMSAHRKGGQSQFVETPLLQTSNQFSEALDWALNNLDQPLSITELAQRANMSRRTFDRKFRSTFDSTPKEWLTNQRLNRAKALLEGEPLSIERIADLTGFDNATTMRHHFRKSLGVSPTQYRDQFAAPSVSGH